MAATDVSIIDDVLGGIEPGSSLVLAGPVGSGRTVIMLQLVAAALRRGERGVILTSEPPAILLRQAHSLKLCLDDAVRSGQLIVLEAYTEAPESLNDLIKQRYRWTRGIFINFAKLFATIEEALRIRMDWGKLERIGRI